MYRDIKTGDTGADVKELQRALMRLGLYHGVIDGEYGQLTANSVKNLYKRVGAVLPEASQETETPSAGAQNHPQDKQNIEGAAEQPAKPAPRKPNLPIIKANEIVSLTSGSAHLIEIAPVNTRISAEKPLAKLRSGQAVAVARVGVGDKELFSVGATVDLTSTGSVDKQHATITAISEFKNPEENSESSLPGHDVTVNLPTEGYTDGQDVTLSIANTERQAVSGLTVPLSALREDTGKTYVLVKDPAVKPDGVKKIDVTVGRTFDGFALVNSEQLHDGDTVVLAQ